MSEIILSEEYLSESLIAEFTPKLERHWDEVERLSESIKLKLDVEKFAMLDNLDLLKIVTARVAGDIVGYGVFVINPSLTVSGTASAVNIALCVSKEYRKHGLGKCIIDFSKDLLRECGVIIVTLHSKASNPQDAFYESLGAICDEKIYMLDIREV